MEREKERDIGRYREIDQCIGGRCRSSPNDLGHVYRHLWHKPARSHLFPFMDRTHMLKVLRVLIITDSVRNLVDYESYCTFIGFFLYDVLDRDGHDKELAELCYETIIL